MTFERVRVVELSIAVLAVVPVLVFVAQLVSVKRSLRWEELRADVAANLSSSVHGCSMETIEQFAVE
jgi:hypothetical protein